MLRNRTRSVASLCAELALEFIEIHLEKKKDRWCVTGQDFSRPEDAVFSYLQGEGFCGSACESGAIFTVLKACCLDFLVSVNISAARRTHATDISKRSAPFTGTRVPKLSVPRSQPILLPLSETSIGSLQQDLSTRHTQKSTKMPVSEPGRRYQRINPWMVSYGSSSRSLMFTGPDGLI